MGGAAWPAWVRAGTGRGGWERESEPVDDPTLLEDSEPGEGGGEGGTRRNAFTYRHSKDGVLLVVGDGTVTGMQGEV